MCDVQEPKYSTQEHTTDDLHILLQNAMLCTWRDHVTATASWKALHLGAHSNESTVRQQNVSC